MQYKYNELRDKSYKELLEILSMRLGKNIIIDFFLYDEPLTREQLIELIVYKNESRF